MEILNRIGLGNCAKCPSRSTCSTLCTEAEVYADQDFVVQRELLIGLPIADSLEEFCMTTEDEEEPQYTPKEKAILMLLLNGYTIERICDLLEISRNTFRVHFCNLRRKS